MPETATVKDAKRYLVTRYTIPQEDADKFHALPDELEETISEVHFAPGPDQPDGRVGLEGTYAIDLYPDIVPYFESATNLVPGKGLLEIARFGLGAERPPEEGRMVETLEHLDTSRYPTPEPGESFFEAIEDVDYSQYSPTADAVVRTYKYWTLPEMRLNQGHEGACTGHSGCNFLNVAPMMSELGNEFARQIYFEAQKRDPWDGGAYPGASPFYEGSTVDAVLDYFKEQGFIETYQRLTDTASRQWLLYVGPAIYSMDWYEGMYVPNSLGYIRPTGRKVGGHAILERGRSKWDDTRFLNSWGYGWGYRGMAWLSKADRLWYWNNDPWFEIFGARQVKDAG